MDDRELLEMAAKAAGLTINKPKQRERDEAGFGHMGLWTMTTTNWNPLTDDGDALRLAVKLGICIEFLPDAVRCKVPGIEWIGETCLPCDMEYLGVAHRRAIVRAAAEIGRAAQQSKEEDKP
jgi:hypothetical protein